MCGICGQYNYEDHKSADATSVKRMTEALVHRGPDDEGYYISGSLGLGFRRLSIIDLESGHQPMSDIEKAVWVVFNGEIYNFPELKKELEAYGHVFQTKSDTEVIVYGYKQWGVDVLEHLNGMFGLAIWDERKKQLLLARDRMGIKPLYYKIDSGRLFFASEIRALLTRESVKPAVDPVAMNLFLRYRYTPSPLTIIQGIRKLAPGTRLIVKNGSYCLERWWKYKPVPFDPMPTVKQAEENLIELYKRALNRHLISDVPLGVLLSGGLDSGLLLALMKQYGDSWNTYTVGFGKKFIDDELSSAAYTANVLNCPNHVVQLDREKHDSTPSEVIAILEEPIAASSIVPMYHLCKRAREDVKVVLMGQGPDELFGGYKRHLGVRYGSYWRSLPISIRKLLSTSLQYLPRNELIKRALYSLDMYPRMKRYQQVFSIMPEVSIDGLFHEGILPSSPGDTILNCWADLEPLMEETDELGGLQFLEIRSSLPDELLMYADKLSMTHGLEIRVPYLDLEIVEYVERLSASFKVRKLSGKWLHRRVCKKFLPKKIVHRKKLGFQTPVDEWLRKSLTSKVDNVLLNKSSLMYNYICHQKVQRLVENHRIGKNNNSKILFSLVVLEEWLRQYIN